MSHFLYKFKSEDNAQKIIEFIGRIKNKMNQDKIPISRTFYKNVINILLTYQNWELLIDTLNDSDPVIMQQEFRTMTFLKESLIYCIDTKIRSEIREKINEVDRGRY